MYSSMQDIWLKVIYPNKEEHEYRGYEEIANHISLNHYVYPVMKNGYSSAGYCIPVVREALSFYGIEGCKDKKGDYLPLYILCHRVTYNEDSGTHEPFQFIIPWNEIVGMVQNQASEETPLEFPHLQPPR